jgi:site-specific recombinase XerD
MRKGNRVVSTRMSTKAVRKVVKEYAEMVEIAIAPHDLRCTYAKLARKGGAPLEQIQITLGHQSLNTTQKYLGTDLDYAQAACDYIGINFSAK